MTLRCFSDNLYHGSPRGLLQIIYDTIQGHQQPIWLLFAAISLLSARHLLIEKNFHYPVQLYLHQIVATAIIALVLHLRQRRTHVAKNHEPWGMPSARETLLVASAHSFAAMSIFCTLQASLHFTNLPVLVMLTTVAFFTEGLILYVAGFSIQSRAELLRLVLLMACCAGILIAEYRLGVPQLVSSIPAMLFAGIASALRKLAIKHYPVPLVDDSTKHRWLVSMSSLVVIAWMFGPWSTEHMARVDLDLLPLLAINACSGAVALLMGASILFPMDMHADEQLSSAEEVTAQPTHDVLTLLALTGCVGCYTTLAVRRSYTSQYQFVCFFLAILCIGSKSIYDVDRSFPLRRWVRGRVYEILMYSPARNSTDAEVAQLSDEVSDSQLRISEDTTKGITFRAFMITILMGLLWIAYLCLNAQEQRARRVGVNLDRKYAPTQPIEVVLSMYKEPTYEVAQLITNLRSMPQLSEARVTIYIKDDKADIAHIKRLTNASNVIMLPNIGREGETYLNHIVNQWDNLAAKTIFLQADIHNPREFYRRLSRFYHPHQTGFLSLGWVGSVCNSDNCGDRHFWQDETHLFPEIQSRISNSTTSEHILLSYKGQFIVSAARIRGIDKSIYHDLRQAFVNPKSWAHQQEYIRGRQDSMSQPWFGYTVERIWNLLFQCNDMDIAWKCPSLVSGWRPGGNLSDCQCFDS